MAVLTRIVFAVCASCVALLAITAPAWAHEDLAASTPTDGAVLTTAPTEVLLEFTDSVTPADEPVVVTGPAGRVPVTVTQPGSLAIRAGLPRNARERPVRGRVPRHLLRRSSQRGRDLVHAQRTCGRDVVDHRLVLDHDLDHRRRRRGARQRRGRQRLPDRARGCWRSRGGRPRGRRRRPVPPRLISPPKRSTWRGGSARGCAPCAQHCSERSPASSRSTRSRSARPVHTRS